MNTLVICLGLVGNIQVVKIEGKTLFLKDRLVKCTSTFSSAPSKEENSPPEEQEASLEHTSKQVFTPPTNNIKKSSTGTSDGTSTDTSSEQQQSPSTRPNISSSDTVSFEDSTSGSTDKSTQETFYNADGTVSSWTWKKGSTCFRSGNLPAHLELVNDPKQPQCKFAYHWLTTSCETTRVACAPKAVVEYESTKEK